LSTAHHTAHRRRPDRGAALRPGGRSRSPRLKGGRRPRSGGPHVCACSCR